MPSNNGSQQKWSVTKNKNISSLDIYIISDKTSKHLQCSGLSLHSTFHWDIKELPKQIDQVIMT